MQIYLIIPYVIIFMVLGIIAAEMKASKEQNKHSQKKGANSVDLFARKSDKKYSTEDYV